MASYAQSYIQISANSCVKEGNNLIYGGLEATVQKIISEILTFKPGYSFAKDARDLLIDCSVEFITLISSEANDIAEREAKKTIAAEHVTKALEELGFEGYVPDIKDEAAEHKEKQKTKEKRQTRWEKSGKSEEELLREQEELFGLSREKYNQEGPSDGA
ncbi:MAG: negative cofactor 2 transcription regulator complex subunit ncb2 [Trichoglossum hirsutum]|nr:MAG: negative cofactor 2 transcription regulator complex subunit ncb2 [Trichoglossum hirsutum]